MKETNESLSLEQRQGTPGQAADISNKLIGALLGIGLLGAVLVGLGEFLEQYHSSADYADPAYGYFASIPLDRIVAGHFLAAFSIPLYFPGYLGMFLLLNRQRSLKPVSSWLMLCGGIYSISVGGIWLGMRASIALVQHRSSMFASTEHAEAFIADLAALNEPLIQIVRVLIALVSVFYWVAFWKSHGTGSPAMPRWLLFCAPVVPLALIFGAFVLDLAHSRFFLANAMNVAHMIFFGAPLSVFAFRYIHCWLGECGWRT